MPFFFTANDGLELCTGSTNIPKTLFMEQNVTYNVALTLNRAVVGLMKNILVFQFTEFSLCRFLSFQIHDRSTEIHLSSNAVYPRTYDEKQNFPDLSDSGITHNMTVKIKQKPAAPKKAVAKIAVAARCKEGVKPPM